MKQAFLGLSNHKILCRIGVLPHEQTLVQEVVITLQVACDVAACVEEDNLDKAIDYRELARVCQSIAEEKHHFLIETLAHRILQKLKKDFPISWARVRLEKPSALPSAAYCFIELEERFE